MEIAIILDDADIISCSQIGIFYFLRHDFIIDSDMLDTFFCLANGLMILSIIPLDFSSKLAVLGKLSRAVAAADFILFAGDLIVSNPF